MSEQASFYSTVAMSMYSVASFFVSPVVATLSDAVGRRPVFLVAAVVDSFSAIVIGLVPGNWVFIAFYR
jgi:MFS family permease